MDLGTLKIVEWIAHDVKRVTKSDVKSAPLELSEVAASADPKVAEFFRSRIAHALQKFSHEVVGVGAENTSPVPDQIKLYVAGKVGLVEASQVFAKHLRLSQSGATSAGLLVTAKVMVDGQIAIALLKLEPQDGAQAVRKVVKGKVTYEVSVLDDLVLTKGTRVFKVALFGAADSTAGTISGRAADPQNTSAATDLADFFLRTFLGCELTETPDVTTRRFLTAAEEFINTQVPDPEKRAEYTVAMHAEIRGNHTDLSVPRFATEALDVGDRKAFQSHMQEAQVPVQPFGKSKEAVEAHLKKVSFAFVDGSVVLTSTASLEDGTVTVNSADDGKTSLKILEQLRRISGRSR